MKSFEERCKEMSDEFEASSKAMRAGFEASVKEMDERFEQAVKETRETHERRVFEMRSTISRAAGTSHTQEDCVVIVPAPDAVTAVQLNNQHNMAHQQHVSQHQQFVNDTMMQQHLHIHHNF